MSCYFWPILLPSLRFDCIMSWSWITYGSRAVLNWFFSSVMACCQRPISKSTTPKSVDVMDLAEQLLRRPLPVWMPVDVPLEAVVREPVREVHLRPAVLEPKHERLLP